MSMLDENKAMEEYFNNREYYDTLAEIGRKYNEWINTPEGHETIIKEYLKNIPKEEINKIKQNIDNLEDISTYDKINKIISEKVYDAIKNNDKAINKIHKWFKNTTEQMKNIVHNKLDIDMPRTFKNGDIVLFCWKPNHARWKKGKVVANNFAMCNCSDFCEKPYYYITEIIDGVEINERTYAIERDSKYIIKYEDNLEWYIGKESTTMPTNMCERNDTSIKIEEPEVNIIGITDINNNLENINNSLHNIERILAEKLDRIENILTMLSLCGNKSDNGYEPLKVWYETDAPDPTRTGWRYNPGPYCTTTTTDKITTTGVTGDEQYCVEHITQTSTK